MTPTEQDKELREKINSLFESVFSQGVRAGKDVATETYEDFNAWRKGCEIDEIMQLITADRQRVALEARINTAEHIQNTMVSPTSAYYDEISANEIPDYIAELKAQQED